MGRCIGKLSVSVPRSSTHDTPTVPAQEPQTPQSSLNDQRLEIKSLIASHLDLASKKALRPIDRSFRQAGAERLEKLTIPATEIEHLDRQLKDFCNVSTGIITGRLGDTELAQLAGMSLETRNKITHISLHANISDAGLVLLKNLPQLRSLDLAACRGITNLAPLQGLTQLQLLNLSGCTRIADPAPLQGLTQLQSLNLTECHGITDLAALQNLTKLQSLDLSWCTSITNLTPLRGLTQLQSLNLAVCTSITNLTPLQGLTQLQLLDLMWCDDITDLAPLQGLTKLQSLDLALCSNITDLTPLLSLTQLQSLNLRGCIRITDAGVAGLKSVLSNCDVRF